MIKNVKIANGCHGCLMVTNSFSTNKQYQKIKLMQNEANRWSIDLKA